MPNTDTKFNPSYSTIKTISFIDSEDEVVLNVNEPNPYCQFERLEFSENITDIFPNGTLLLRDVSDIVTFIEKNKVAKLRFYYVNGYFVTFDITSSAYINNASSATDQVFVAVYFTNLYYKFSQQHSLNSELIKVTPDWLMPQVYRTEQLVKYITLNVLYKQLVTPDYQTVPLESLDDSVSKTDNYVLYKTLNPKQYRIESPTDSPIQYLNYLASMATPFIDEPQKASGPRFMFWTDFKNNINFKYFPENIDEEEDSSFEKIDEKYLRFGVYNGDAVVQKLSDEKSYRKIYFLRTDPNNQFVSKNYHYVRKTPKIMDEVLTNRGSSYYANTLMYQFQDEGQKYNIELISSKGNTGPIFGATAGSDEILCESHWGYYNELKPVNDGKSLTHLGQNFGNEKPFSSLLYMGNTGYFPYVDNPEMWKNMFDFTPVHPHYPDEKTLPPGGIAGSETYLQKIINIRYKNFSKSIEGSSGDTRLELARKIEKQNFIMYTLCCMAKEEKSFFALLTAYELDNTMGSDYTYGPYRYNWVKLNFNSPYGNSGPEQMQGKALGCGGTYWIHQVEKWEKDSIWVGNTGQDDTWAINLNERAMGMSGAKDYLAPGWVSQSQTGTFKWRPIGITQASFGKTGYINHIVKMNVVPYTDLLLGSHNLIGSTYVGKYLYYFSAENVVDGTC